MSGKILIKLVKKMFETSWNLQIKRPISMIIDSREQVLNS